MKVKFTKGYCDVVIGMFEDEAKARNYLRKELIGCYRRGEVSKAKYDTMLDYIMHGNPDIKARDIVNA